MKRAIFLDRDGVLNENRPNYVRSVADLEFIPEAVKALTTLAESDSAIILVTNQSAIGRGIITLAEANSINTTLLQHVQAQGGRIDAVYMCQHTPEDQCRCRKPQPGLLLQAAKDHGINLSKSIMIGDALTDLQAGRAAGVLATALVLTGRGKTQQQLLQAHMQQPDGVYNNLSDALCDLRLKGLV